MRLFLYNQPHLFHTLTVLCAGRNDIDSRRVYTAVTENIGKLSNILFDSVKQQVAPKKISGRKTLEPQRFLGFFRAIFQGGIQKISFPKNGLWGGLELPTQAFGGRFCGLFRKICPFFRFRIC